MTFTKKELSMMQDREFLRTKIIVGGKISELLAETRVSLTKVVRFEKLIPLTSLKSGKISKGENYLGFPYQVLDFPATFSQNNVFAFRTMFWWGHFFSTTLHLEGTHLDFYRSNILNNFSLLLNQNIFIGIGKTPWQYHYTPDNYQSISEDHFAFVESCNFLKLSIKMSLNKWHDVPTFSSTFFRRMLLVLKE